MTRKKPENLPTFAELGGSTSNFRRLIHKGEYAWSAFNPSIMWSEKYGYLCLIRSSNYSYGELGHISLTTENRVKNRTYLARLDADLSIKEINLVTYPDGLEQVRGNEDARLFERNGKVFFHCVMKEDHTRLPRICVYELDVENAVAKFVKKYDSGQYQSVEKNWMTPLKTVNKNFEFVYNSEFVVREKDPLIRVSEPRPSLKDLRGGTSLLELEDGNYLAVCHYTYHTRTRGFLPTTFGYVDGSVRQYSHVYAKFDSKGVITHISDEFVFDKFEIEFASGLENYGDQFVISYGSNDISCNFAFMDKSKVFGLLKPVQE